MRRKTYSSPKNVPVEKLTWLAGVLEGYGNFRPAYSDKNPNNMPRIVVLSTDREVVEEASELFGVGVYEVPNRMPGRWNQQYRVQFTGKAAVEWMNALYPYMKSRKRRQIDHALQKSEAYA